MFAERRRLARRVINRTAQFRSELGSLPRDCMIVDISDGGARLFSEADVPATFTLSVSDEGGDTHRECRVVWRVGGEFGVEFTDRQRR